MLANGPASKNQKKKSKFCESPVVLSPAAPSSILSQAAPSSISSETASDPPFGQLKVVGRGKKRMNSQAVLELETSNEQPVVKRMRAKTIRKSLQRICDNAKDEVELKKLKMIQNMKKMMKKRERNSQHKARQQLDKLLSS